VILDVIQFVLGCALFVAGVAVCLSVVLLILPERGN